MGVDIGLPGSVFLSGLEGRNHKIAEHGRPNFDDECGFSIAGCAQYYGKGKAPPPVVTKG